MNCTNCGNEINEHQKFCSNCGAELNDVGDSTQINNIVKILILLIVAVVLVSVVVFAFNNVEKNTTNATVTEQTIKQATPNDILQEIDRLQAQYFSIIKKHDMFLNIVDCDECVDDEKQLENLYETVKNKIGQDNQYLQRYENIEIEFAENPGQTTVEVNMHASKHYTAIDDLLNETYKAVKSKIPTEDFDKLVKSESAWLKTVEQYNDVYKTHEYGTIRTLVGFNYETDMYKFRTLLLMLYL